MPINIQIDDKDASQFIALFKHVRQDLLKQAEETKAKIARVDAQIHALINGTATFVDVTPTAEEIDETFVSSRSHKNPPYDKKWTWFKKVKFIITEKGGQAGTKDIVNRILEIEPELKERREQIVRTISSFISTSVKEGKHFNRVNDGTANYEYRLKDTTTAQTIVKDYTNPLFNDKEDENVNT